MVTSALWLLLCTGVEIVFKTDTVTVSFVLLDFGIGDAMFNDSYKVK